MKNTVDPWAGRMGAESALLAREGFSGPEHIIDGKEGLFAVFQSRAIQGRTGNVRRRRAWSKICQHHRSRITESLIAG